MNFVLEIVETCVATATSSVESDQGLLAAETICPENTLPHELPAEKSHEPNHSFSINEKALGKIQPISDKIVEVVLDILEWNHCLAMIRWWKLKTSSSPDTESPIRYGLPSVIGTHFSTTSAVSEERNCYSTW